MNLRPPGYEPDELPTALLRDMVPETGVEPARDHSHGILSPGRLPISPLRQTGLSTRSSRVLDYYITAMPDRQGLFCSEHNFFLRGNRKAPCKQDASLSCHATVDFFALSEKQMYSCYITAARASISSHHTSNTLLAVGSTSAKCASKCCLFKR